ncbi:DISARM anti-phage system protein DrmE domain-containing protein [Pedobacter agri]|uniref:DISARM protein DrmE C-terminal domain-containing protein n=1 Tax=Pedobacter agri TaxID=454586 RepID=A0A9X3I8Q1_9SPHI|nr:hypothetical protein [Pedobacter agri]MCX3263713.1 hypothetical protein [Pedobacter agri]
MISKAYLETVISEEFPDLKNTRFTMNHRSLRLFSENTLLPFLIFQNTTDSKNRLISLYMQSGSPGMHLLPFYIALGFYRKAANAALNAQDFFTTRFQPEMRKVVVNGSVCSVTMVDYLSQSLMLHGQNRHFEIPFSQDYKIKWAYSNAHGLRELIDRFQRIQKASDGNIFSLRLKENDKSHEGLILFTQPSRFETLLGNVTISGSSLKEHLNIQKTVFTDQEIKFIQVSQAKTKNMPVTVLLSRPDTLFSYENIMTFGGPSLGKLRTIVIEDFDLLIKAWDRSGELKENLDLLEEMYFSRLGSYFRDIYLVCSNRNFDVHALLASNGITPMAWMLKATEFRRLENMDVLQHIPVSKITTSLLDSAVVALEEIIVRWKSLAMNYFCSGEILALVKILFQTKSRLSSFYQRERFNASLASQHALFHDFAKRWFPGGQDHGLVEQTLKHFTQIQQADYGVNERLAEKINASISIHHHKSLLLVSRNHDIDDQRNLCSLISLAPENIIFSDEKQFLSGNVNLEKECLVVYLGAGKALINMLLTDPGDASQLILTDARGYHFLGWYADRAQAEIDKISPTTEKFELLNLPPDTAFPQDTRTPSRFLFLDEEGNGETSEQEAAEQEEDVVRDIVWNASSRNNPRPGAVESYLVFFEDGSQLGFQQHQSVFIYQENDSQQNEELEKEVKELKMGDQVIVPKSRRGIRNLLSEALASHKSYSRAVDYDLRWRSGIREFLGNNGGIYNFMAILNQKGFPIVVPETIRKWIDGETLQPNRFKRLLLVLVDLGIVEDALKDDYYHQSRELKKIKSRFIKSAILKLIYSLKNISHGWQEDIFDEQLLDSFIDHVEVKTVLTVVAK